MIIDQLPLLGGDVQGTDEFPIERGTTTYKTTHAALIKEAIEKGLPPGGTAGQVLTKADSSDYSASWEDPSGGGTNLLDNWYFVGGGSQLGYGVFPINQREQQIYSNSNAYTIDRWKLTDGSFTVASGGITLNGTIVQTLPACVGLPVVASARLSDGTMITPSYNDSTKTFTLTATGQTISAVKLEVGDAQTLAHQENGVWVLNEIPNYAEELAKCQAYYLHHVGYASVGFLADTGSAYVNIVTPSTMAKTPTLEVVQYNNLIHGATIEPITRASVSELRKNAVTVEVGVATTGVFELCMTADFMVNLSAE